MESVVATVSAVIEDGMCAAAISMALDQDFTQERAEMEVRAIYRSASQRPLFMKDAIAHLVIEAIGAFAESEGFTGSRRTGFVGAWLGNPACACGSSDILAGWQAGFIHPAKPQLETFLGIEP
ncbi:hypothetical protein [Alcaligenes phenolicus]|uniref:hypothetical protein n=1 Tax=Alcaligenes phenolicus TaxID=232846 RepID=UPI002AA930CA|nr:hypothetical protein [Alcaligenes phenolicus]